MARSSKLMVLCLGLVITLFVLIPAAGLAWKLDIPVTYADEDGNGCPDAIVVHDVPTKWWRWLSRPEVRWVEHPDIHDHE